MSARFALGQTVRVRAAYTPGHVRTPFYVRGRTGIVDAVAGTFRNPEELAYGRGGEPALPLYRVRFSGAELWADSAERGRGSVVVDIFEHWLEPAQGWTR